MIMPTKLEQVPESLRNTTGEDCMLSCVGMALQQLGVASLSLSEIKLAFEGEDISFKELFSWLGSKGVSAVWIEDLQNDPELAGDLNECGRSNLTHHPVELRPLDVVDGMNAGHALIVQVGSSFTEQYPDHAVYVSDLWSDDDTCMAVILDPDSKGRGFGVSIEDIWGNYPNLLALKRTSMLD